LQEHGNRRDSQSQEHDAARTSHDGQRPATSFDMLGTPSPRLNANSASSTPLPPASPAGAASSVQGGLKRRWSQDSSDAPDTAPKRPRLDERASSRGPGRG
jgi:hypothetical protein